MLQSLGSSERGKTGGGGEGDGAGGEGDRTVGGGSVYGVRTGGCCCCLGG